MANLLPKPAEKKILRYAAARAIAGGSFVALAAAAASLFALAPAFIVVNAGHEVQTGVGGIATSSEVTRDRDELTRVRTLLSGLSAFSAAPGRTRLALELALSKRPPEITIEKILYSAQKKTIVLHCQTAKRESIAGFREALRAEKMFTSVSIPIEELAGRADGSFTVTIAGDF